MNGSKGMEVVVAVPNVELFFVTGPPLVHTISLFSISLCPVFPSCAGHPPAKNTTILLASCHKSVWLDLLYFNTYFFLVNARNLVD